MQIVTRSQWGARSPRSRFLITTPTPKLYLHHTVSASGGSARVRAIQNFHMDVRGWSDIAYSYLVNAEGTIFEGRGAGVAGGHTAGQNTVSHAICAMGNYDQTQPPQVMLDAIRRLVAHGHGKGWWPARITGGHRDAPGANTSCPGSKLYALIPSINLQEEPEVVTEQDKRDIAKLAADEILGRQFNETFTVPGEPISRSVSQYLVQNYGLGVRAVRGSEQAASNTTAAKITAAVIAAGVAGAAAGPTVHDIVSEMGRRLAGG